MMNHAEYRSHQENKSKAGNTQSHQNTVATKQTGKVVCVDLDGVLAQYSGWKSESTIGDPLPDAQKLLEALHERYVVTIHTTRQTPYVWDWLERHGLSSLVSHVNWCRVTQREGVKPIAVAYIDDRAIHYDPQKSPFDSIDSVLSEVDRLASQK